MELITILFQVCLNNCGSICYEFQRILFQFCLFQLVLCDSRISYLYVLITPAVIPIFFPAVCVVVAFTINSTKLGRRCMFCEYGEF